MDESDSESDRDHVEDAEKYYDSGLLYRASGDFHRSIFELSKALAIFSSASTRSRAQAQIHLSDQWDLESANVLMSMGLAHQLLGETSQVITCYRTAFDIRSKILGFEVSCQYSWQIVGRLLKHDHKSSYTSR